MPRTSATDFIKLINSRIISTGIYRWRTKHFGRSMTSQSLLRKFPGEFHNSGDLLAFIKPRLRERFFLSDLNKKEFYINLMTSLGGFDPILDDADLVHENKFQTLGSETYSFGEKIDWHLDFKSGKRWEPVFYSKIDALGANEPSDIKVPWEVSRFHQAIWLGKAYWISHSESHAEKFKELVNDWIDKNPVGYGVNWNTPMEASIRAINLIVGMLYFTGSPRLDDEFILKLLCSLYEHGVFIRFNLERSLRNHNHLLSNLVGLVYLGILFHDTKAGKRWVEFGRRELEKEIVNQVYEDGTDYEKSTSYQRLVTEIFTAAYVLLKLNGFSLSEMFTGQLEKMFGFLAAATMRDGRVPNIGDADDGRIFRMKSGIDFNDHRDLLAVGASLFGRADLKAAAGSFSELALLLLGGGGFERFSSIAEEKPVPSAIFKEGGFAFLRTQKDFCSFDFGDIGLRGRGGHGHNDVLGFTIAGKNPFIVDRGTYCYTCDTATRNRLRSTYSHNSVIVDGAEQAEFSGLWSIKYDPTAPELLNWKTSEEQDVIEARQHAYERLPQPVTHLRGITFNKRQRTFRVEDHLLGEGTHTVELMFHFAPGLRVVDLGRNFLALEGEEFVLMKFQHPFTLEDWEHSPSYGILQPARTARVKLEADLPATIETYVFIISGADDMNHLLNRIQSTGAAG